MNLNQLCQEIRAMFLGSHPEKIILFGSWARGKEDPWSDVDLIIVSQTRKRFLDRLEDLYSQWKLPLAVDILAYTPEEIQVMIEEENPLLLSALREGVIVYEKPPAGSQALV